MPLKTKSIYDPAEPGDGVRLLVTRFYPRGVKKDRFTRWDKALSPSRELLKSYKGGSKTWEGFRRGFLDEILETEEGLEALKALDELSRAETVTLLCYERSGEPCHRHVVVEILADPRLRSRYLKSVRFYPRDRVGRRTK